MAFDITAFAEFSSLRIHDPSIVAPLGELAPTQKTYAKEVFTYSKTAYPNMDLHVFWSRNGKVHVATPPTVIDTLLEVAGRIANYRYDGSALNDIKQDFPTFEGIVLGNILEYGGTRMPNRIEFKLPFNNQIYNVNIFFGTDSFRNNYPHREVVILPPTVDVEDLYDTHVNVLQALDENSIVSMTDRINEVTRVYPQTELKPIRLRWNEPTDPNKYIITTWTAVCYGPQASRHDVILEEIRQYLLDNTSHTINEWRNYLPDIQFAKIFHMIPIWGKQAISAGPNTQDAYSPIIRSGEITSIAKHFMPNTPESDITTYGEATSILYKSLGMIIIGAGGNEEGQRWFSELYPKYTVINVNGQNNGRIPESVLSVINKMEILVRLAEVDTGIETLPNNITRSIISGITYLDVLEGGIILRMVPKSTWAALYDAGADLPGGA